MMKNGEKLSFEDALSRLEKVAEALKSEDTKLEDAMKLFEEGLEHYNNCSELLAEAKQKIMIFDRNMPGLKEME